MLKILKKINLQIEEKYSQCDLEIQIKARFLFRVYLIGIMVLFVLLGLYLLNAPAANTFIIFKAIFSLILILILSLIALWQGKYELSLLILSVLGLLSNFVRTVFPDFLELSTISMTDSTSRLMILILFIILFSSTYRMIIFIYLSSIFLLIIKSYSIELTLASRELKTCMALLSFATLFGYLIRHTYIIMINKLNHSNTKLKQSEEQYRSLINQIQSAVVVYSSDNRVIASNKKAQELFGLAEEQMTIDSIEESTWNFINIDGSVLSFEDYPASQVLSTKMSLKDHSMGLYRHDQNSVTWLLTNGDPVFDNQGNILQAVVTFADITITKQEEEERINLQKITGEEKKLALVGQIAGKMAHDFNNILGIIMGNAELALMDCRNKKFKKTFELIFEQTIRGKNITKNLVAFAKDQEPKQEFFKITEKIDLVINLLRKDLEGIKLIVENEPEVSYLLADPGMIEHSLINLIQNSIHATSKTKSPVIFIRTYSLNDKICIEIEDNGCGILEKHFENIYDPSFTLKGSRDESGSYENGIKGTGYGMSNVKKYITLHKGGVSFESKFGTGTKFIISLPIIKMELTSEEKREILEQISYSEKHILLVEDETAISDILYQLMTQDPCNHKVQIANNGPDAIDLFNKHNYDLISLDYVLPGGINGMDIYNHIRKTNKTVPILFVSGNIEFLESIKELRQRDIFIDHLSKPCENKAYVSKTNALMEKALKARI